MIDWIGSLAENRGAFLAILCLSAVLEVAGDVIINKALGSQGANRGILIVTGAAVLLAYSLLLNATSKELGPMLAVYVACFFVVAQLIDIYKTQTLPGWQSITATGLVALAAWLFTTAPRS